MQKKKSQYEMVGKKWSVTAKKLQRAICGTSSEVI